MAHKLSLNFGALGKSSVFGNQMFQLMPKGIYEIPTLTRINDATVEVGTFVAYITDSANELGMRIEIDAAENVSVDSTNIYLIARLNFTASLSNDFVLMSTILGGITSDDIVLGKCNYSGSTLVDFDTTVQTLSPLRNNGTTLSNQLDNIFFPSVFTAADYVVTSDQKSVTIFVDTTITNRNITFPTADINSVGNYIGVYNIAGANNAVANSTFTVLPGRAMYFRCTQTGSSTYAWARIFSDEYVSAATAPAVTPSKIGQLYIDSSNFQSYIAKGTSSSADWRGLQPTIQNIISVDADYVIADTIPSGSKILVSPNSGAQKGLITVTLPTMADNIGKWYDIEFKTGQGLIMIDGEGSETLSFKGESILTALIYSKGGNYRVFNNGSNWIMKGTNLMRRGYTNESDESYRNYGNGVTYDNGSGTSTKNTDWTGQLVTSSVDGFSGVVVEDTGGTGTTGILYVYELSSGFLYWTNDRKLTASNGQTIDINEPSGGNTKNVSSLFYDGFGIKSEFRIIKFSWAKATTYTEANFLTQIVSGSGTSRLGLTLNAVDTNSFYLACPDEGTVYSAIFTPPATFSVNILDNDDYAISILEDFSC